jgi:hypothetical protein
MKSSSALPAPSLPGAMRLDAGEYQDIPGYCRSVNLAEIAEHGHVLTPGRYVGAEAVEDDDEAFAGKMQKLTEKLGEQMAKGAELDALIRQKLGGLGYEFLTVVFLSGNTPSKSNTDYWGTGTSWISAKDMKSFWVESAEDTLTAAGVEAASRLVEPGTTLLLTRGMTLHHDVPIVRTRFAAAFNQDVKAVVPRSRVLADYVPYLLLGNKPRLRSMVDSAGHGTGRLNSDSLKALQVAIPSIEEQRDIASFFGAIDDRIALLRETNATLEAIAQALFKSWFVDFDPVSAKQEGRAPEGMGEATAALFPDGFEESELGLVPRGWRVAPLGEVVQSAGGGTPDTKDASYWEAQHFWNERPASAGAWVRSGSYRPKALPR